MFTAMGEVRMNLFFNETCLVEKGRCIAYHLHKVVSIIHVWGGNNVYDVNEAIIDSN